VKITILEKANEDYILAEKFDDFEIKKKSHKTSDKLKCLQTHIEAWVEGKDYNIDVLLDLKGKLINENRDILGKTSALDEKCETKN